jgi:tetratricopeptide (TPR) repeat protein
MDRTVLSSLLACLLLGTASSQSASWQQAFQQGTQAAQQGRFDEAAADFRAVVQQNPTFAPAYLDLGLALQGAQKPDEAIAALKHAVALDPKLRGAELFLGIAYYKTGNGSEAIRVLRSAALHFPSDAKVWMWLGIAQLADGKYDDAARSLDKAAALDPDDVDIMYHRGRAHMLVSKQIYSQMYEKYPKSWRIHQVLAQSFEEQDKTEEAAREYQRAIALAPQEPGLHESLGDIEWMINDLDAAKAAYEAERQIDPYSTSVLYKLGALYIVREQPSEGLPLLQEALKRNPGLYQAHFWLGRAAESADQTRKAIEEFEIAATANPEDTDTRRSAYYHLVRLYRKEGQPDKAREALQQFEQLRALQQTTGAHRIEEKIAEQQSQ